MYPRLAKGQVQTGFPWLLVEHVALFRHEADEHLRPTFKANRS